MRIGEYAVRFFVNAQDSFVARKARQHNVATGGKARNTFRKGTAVSNQLLRLAAVPVISGQLEAGFEQPLRNRPPHVTDSDKSELIFLPRDCFHAELAFRRGLNSGSALCFANAAAICGTFDFLQPAACSVEEARG